MNMALNVVSGSPERIFQTNLKLGKVSRIAISSCYPCNVTLIWYRVECAALLIEGTQ